jgi:hypothetical protein
MLMENLSFTDLFKGTCTVSGQPCAIQIKLLHFKVKYIYGVDKMCADVIISLVIDEDIY